MTKVLIDGDILAYRSSSHKVPVVDERGVPVIDEATGVGLKRPCTLEEALDKVDELVEVILNKTLFIAAPHEYQVYLTGSGNFRFDIAKSHVYKGNRKDVAKPLWLYDVRQHLREKWNAIVSNGEEADDLIAIEATRYGPDTIVASIDKDMLQIPCRHYNFGRDEWYTVNEFQGLVSFYTQILTGDASDNIIGLYKVGPTKAKKILEGCKTEEDLWEAVVKAYSGDEDRVIENARLLWLRRKEGELWQPPAKREA